MRLPLVRELMELLRTHPEPLSSLAEEAGVPVATVTGWRSGHNPRLDLFEHLLNALGYDLKIVRRGD